MLALPQWRKPYLNICFLQDVELEKLLHLTEIVLTGEVNPQLFGGREIRREVYFNIRCDIWLKKYLDRRDDNDLAIFVTERNPHRMSIAQMRYVIKRISNQAGINKIIHPHQLKHSYATHLLNNGAPLEVIQSLLGHEKSETTRIYAQLTGRLRQEFYRKYFYRLKSNKILRCSFQFLHQYS